MLRKLTSPVCCVVLALPLCMGANCLDTARNVCDEFTPQDKDDFFSDLREWWEALEDDE